MNNENINKTYFYNEEIKIIDVAEFGFLNVLIK